MPKHYYYVSMMTPSSSFGPAEVPPAAQIHYALSGLSARAVRHFVLPLTGKGRGDFANDFSATSRLETIFDPDPLRVLDFNRKTGLHLTCHPPEAMDRILRLERPDVLLIGGPDHTHFHAIMTALEAVCDVIVEKPMVLTSQEARAVLDAEKRTGRQVRIAFNVRYQPEQQAIKRLLMRGSIGKVVNIEFTYHPGSEHGASYFLRWNRHRALSGGLNLHKSCHHFDLINWLLDDWPETVFAFGDRHYFGPQGAHRPRDQEGNPLSAKETRANCPYFQHHFAPNNRDQQERVRPSWDPLHLPYHFQYPPDQHPYLYDETIDIEDTFGVLIRYQQGAILNYSINFSTPQQGLRLALNGTKGRIELSRYHECHPSSDGEHRSNRNLRVLPLFGTPYDVPLKRETGGHGGADEPLQRDLFAIPGETSRELNLLAGSLAGAYAVAAGEAVATAIRSGVPVALPRF